MQKIVSEFNGTLKTLSDLFGINVKNSMLLLMNQGNNSYCI